MAGRSHPGWGMFVRKIAVACSVLFGVLLVASSLGVNGFGFGHPRDRQSGPESDPGTTSRVREAFGTLPLSFVENRGQVDPRVAYYVPGHDTAFYFTREGVTIALTGSTLSRASGPDGLRDVARQTGLPSLPDREGSPQRWAVKLDFVGANPEVRPVGQDPTPAVVSYFKGPREAWKTGLPTYASVVYPNLWPGIDLVYTGTATRLKYTFLVHPGADPDRIELACRGATAVTLTDGGELDVSTPLGGFRDAKPYAYQEMEGRRVGVGATYALSPDAAGAHGYGFRLGSYDRARLLVLDPAILVYAGYIGGSSFDRGSGIAVDSAGNAYVTGFTTSTEATFPETVGPDLTYNGNLDAFVAKVNAAGTALLYAGYIGGSADEGGYGIAVDVAGNAYVTGFTSSSEATFPVTVGPDLTFNGAFNAFVAKVNAAGTALVYAGYIGGSGGDEGFGIAVDSAGNAYVTGLAQSSEATFPVTVGPDLTFNGNGDAFVAKVNAAGTALLYAGYIGGSADEGGYGIAVDVAGNAYVTGVTDSSETTFPVTVGPDLTYNGGSDAFVAEVNAGGTALVYAGYVGGASGELGFGIAVDVEGNAYVTGQTSSSEATFPETVGPDLTYNGNGDAFIAKIAELAPPATLTLSPATDTNPVGTSHTVTATVEDAFGNPVPDVVVRFTVTGSVSAQGPCTTNSNGQCDFTYQGPDLPGADVITAFGDTDGDGTQDAGEPTGAAAKIWVLPVTTPLCEIIITDGGWIIANNGDKANFGGNAKSSESGATSGQQQYRDRGPAQPMRVQSINVLAIVCDGTSQASIYGQATIDGSGSFFYRIKVKDVAEPGAGQDTYWIILETGYNSGEHTLGGGNVQIHRG